MKKIKLAIADDQTLFLKGMRFIIQTFENIDLIIEASNGQSLIDKIENNIPDIILLDIKMPGMDGIETLKKIRSRHADIKIILLTMYNDERLISLGMEVGANGYLLKDEDSEVVREAIHSVYKKGFYFNDYVSKALLRQVKKKTPNLSKAEILDSSIRLSKRETEVLSLICQEMSTNDIAKQLYISSRTVEGHRKNLLEKTGAKNVVGLVIFAVKNKLIELN